MDAVQINQIDLGFLEERKTEGVKMAEYIDRNAFLWNYCKYCGKRIEVGVKCYGLPRGESVCASCCVEENELREEKGDG